MLNSNQIERFYNYNKQSPKINFVPRLCPRHSRDAVFLSLFVPWVLLCLQYILVLGEAMSLLLIGVIFTYGQKRMHI